MITYEVPPGKILIKRDQVENEDSGVLMPENVRKPPATGVVQVIGRDVTFVKIGDRIVFNRYAGMFLEVSESLEEPDLIVLGEDEVLAKMVKT